MKSIIIKISLLSVVDSQASSSSSLSTWKEKLVDVVKETSTLNTRIRVMRLLRADITPLMR